MNRAETLLVGGCARALPIQLSTYIRVKQSARFGQVNVNNGGRYCVSGAGQAQTNSSAASFTQLLPPLSISMLFHSFFFVFWWTFFCFRLANVVKSFWIFVLAIHACAQEGCAWAQLWGQQIEDALAWRPLIKPAKLRDCWSQCNGTHK